MNLGLRTISLLDCSFTQLASLSLRKRLFPFHLIRNGGECTRRGIHYVDKVPLPHSDVIRTLLRDCERRKAKMKWDYVS